MTTTDSLTTYELTGERLSPRRMRIDTGDAEFVVGADVNPVEYFLGAVLGCLNSTGSVVARDMDVTIDELTVQVAGDVDYATYRGEPSDARPGLQELDVEISVESDADEETIDAWLAAVENRCPVTDNVENETAVTVSVESA
ncbi:putative redox protein, regulator of disulfide bond formation [Halovivax ruber XH-70]|uniref:Putative redox protein, regulator of disulfide bond formation n=1 Tax=Halovivax ruber (strain DSM 18193 / JCM 13892 / XH-70) TaxID=797302 RepID=L0IGZ3_HALRX|nr:OsmC family protein [Halovivax ruber]AGB17501.1 putative redox protein, regulator of disulfide bond formation [Halovivax ruber XH-70]